MRTRRLKLAIVLALLCGACGSSARTQALKAAFATVQAADTAFVAWDEQHQQALVAQAKSFEEGQQALLAYRQAREPVIFAFAGAFEALAAAFESNTATRAALAFAAAQHLYAALTKLAPELLPAGARP